MKKIAYQIKCSIQALVERICKRFDMALIRSTCYKGKSVYGPVRSDRLGHALCINTIKCKACSYNCIYCQTGEIKDLSIFKSSCLSAYDLFCIVKKKLELLSIQHIPVDHLVFTPQGEPTLDVNLAQKIWILKEFGHKIAIFTNGSLLWSEKTQDDLLLADYISIKIDTVNEDTWNILNRPHPKLRFELILDGIRQFSKKYEGTLVTETMFVKNINDNTEELNKLGQFLKSIHRNRSYFIIPTRPPISPKGVPPDELVLKRLSAEINHSIPLSSTAFTPQEDEFFGAGDLEDELIATLSAQPMSEKSVEKFVLSKHGNENTLNMMIKNKLISKILYNGTNFFAIPN